jgi:GntR family transcriptional regulator, transcriptional repressor for pyruvate dehydrogenase complex
MGSFQPTPVRGPRAEVEEQLRQAIALGELAAGDKLPSEPDLAKLFDVSRSTVREALRSLASSGLLRKTPGSGGGTFIREVDSEQLEATMSDTMGLLLTLGELDEDEVAFVREALEVPACRLAAINRTEGDLAELRDLVDSEKEATVADAAVVDLDVSFHGRVARASGNRLLYAFVQAMHNVARPVDYLLLSEDVGRSAVRQHIAICKAIEAQDPDSAERAILDHLAYLRSQAADVS